MAETPEEYRKRLRSIGSVSRRGESQTTISREGPVIQKTTEHWDGRRDVTITPDTARYEAVQHRTGSKKGQVAEIRRKEARK